MTVDYTLYLATDPELIGDRDIRQLVADAIENGVSIVQLRDKNANGAVLYRTARSLLDVTRTRRVPLIINDRVDVMLAARADGVHVGANDLPLEYVRELAGPRAIVGYSVNARDDLDVAERFNADYVGIGPVFPTSTKPDARPAMGLDGLRALTAQASCPAVGIGGITPQNCAAVLACGAAGVCVISAILKQPDIGAAVRPFREALGNSSSSSEE